MPTGIYKRTEYHRRINSEAHKGLPSPKGFLGKKHSMATRAKMSGRIPWSKNNKPSMESRRKMSIAHIGQKKSPKAHSFPKGVNHPNWKGGISNEPYSFDFNEELKESIRRKDNYTCQECNHTEKQLGYKLRVHHIDYDKKNSNPINLISLCKGCHSQTNFKRSDWTNYFNNKLKIYG